MSVHGLKEGDAGREGQFPQEEVEGKRDESKDRSVVKRREDSISSRHPLLSVEEKRIESRKRKCNDSVSYVESESWEKKIKEDATVFSILEEKPQSHSPSEMQSTLDTVKKLYLQEPWEHTTSEIKVEPPPIFPALRDVMKSNIYMLEQQMKFEYENAMTAATRYYHLEYVRNQLITNSASLDVLKRIRTPGNHGCKCGCQR